MKHNPESDKYPGVFYDGEKEEVSQ